MNRDPARLICVPGLGLGASDWHWVIVALQEQGGHVPSAEVRLLPGFGRPGAGVDLSPEALARLVVAAAGPADGQRVVLAGHSASCQIVAHAAAMAPDTVAGLVLCGPTTDPRAATWPRLMARWLRTARHEPLWQVPSLIRQYSQTGLTSMRRAMDLARRDSIERTLQDVRCPVVLIRGPGDRLAPASWLERLASAPGSVRPPASVATLRQGAHMLPLTHPAALARAIGPFLDEVFQVT